MYFADEHKSGISFRKGEENAINYEYEKPILLFQLSFYPITQMNFLCHKRNNREHLLIALFEMKVGCSF